LSTDPPDYATLASEFGFHSAKEVANRIETMKRRLDATVRQVLGEELQTNDSKAIEDELREIRRQMSLANAVNLPAIILSLDKPVSPEDSALRSSSAPQLTNVLELVMCGETRLRDAELSVLYESYLSTPLASLFSHELDGLPGPAQVSSADDRLDTVEQLLVADQPLLETLQRLKQVTTHVMKSRTSLMPMPIAFVLRFVSIGLARVRLRQDISTLAPDVLLQGIQRALQYRWLDDRTRALFEEVLGQQRGVSDNA
jgi:hypothetical protein